MSDINSNNLLVDFKLTNNNSIIQILDNFKIFSKLFSPIVKFKTNYKEIWTAPRIILSDKREAFPAFTDSKMLNTPYVTKPTLEFLFYILSSMKTGAVIFNPPVKKDIRGKQVIVDLYTISLIIGFLQHEMGHDKDENILTLLNKNLFHKANYLCFKNLPNTDKLIYAEVLSFLGFYDKAIEMIKSVNNERALLLKALIERMTGNYQAAIAILENVKDDQLMWEKNLHLAWLNLFTGNIDYAGKIFNQLSGGTFKQEAFFGIALSMLSKQNLTSDAINSAINYLSNAANLDGKNKINILIYLGNLYYNMQEYIKAENCYYKALDITPSVQTLSLIGICEAKRGKFKDAMSKANLCAIFDINASVRILSILPHDYLLSDNRIDSDIIIEEKSELKNVLPAFEEKNAKKQEPSLTEASLEPADISSRKKVEGKAKDKESPIFQTTFETFSSMESAEKKNDNINKQEKNFISRAVSFSSSLEEEFNKKIYFNYEGLTDIERKLRLTFIRENINQIEAIETVKNCAAFLCYFLKERYKGRLIEYEDFDPWSWPMIIPIANTEIVTFPVARIWKILWTNILPDQGWILKYIQYLSDEMTSINKNKPSGIEAVKLKVKSHPEKIFEAEIEHKKNIILVSSLDETRNIEITRNGIIKMDTAIRKTFTPGIPPTTDGWRLLRCFGHLLTEILIKDFKATWFNVEGNDGLWSMELPWKTYIFPIGKVFKAAANGEKLIEYYDKILSDKLKY